MKRISTYLILLLFLAATAYFLVFKQESGSMNRADMAFAVKDTASITKIEILSKTKKTLTLEKQGAGKWRVNQFYKASPELVNGLLETIKQVSVTFPVGEGAYESVMKQFEKPTKIVKIYTDSQTEVFKEYAIGSTTSTGTGLFMLLKDSQQPYVVNIKGLDGNIMSRFSNQLEAWRDRLIFNYTAEDIAKIEASYELNPERSFTLSAKNNNYTVASPSKKVAENQRLNKPVAATYLNSFERLYAEAYENEYPYIDSIRTSKAYCRLKITDKNGKTKQLNVHHRDVNKRTKKQVDVNGVAMDYDSDRYFAFIEGQDDMFLIQEYVFGKVFKGFSDFYYEEVK